MCQSVGSSFSSEGIYCSGFAYGGAECDCQRIIFLLNSSQSCFSELGAIIGDIKAGCVGLDFLFRYILRSFPLYSEVGQ